MFDLDGTLAANTWPDQTIGDPHPEIVEMVKHYRSEGYVVSIFTSRPEDHREMVWTWLRKHDLHHLIYRIIMDKPIYGVLVDDRSFNPWL